MKNRYRLISRGNRGGALYCVDGSTGKRTSLGACSRDEAEQIVLAKNQALRGKEMFVCRIKLLVVGM